MVPALPPPDAPPLRALESARLEAQRHLDRARSPAERNRLGQFATPPALARALLRLGLAQLPADAPLSFLDPALGTGAFYAALLEERGARPLRAALGVEQDAAVATAARRLWAGAGLEVRQGDFTAMTPDRQVNLLICNPPYVRHHHLPPAHKARLRAQVEAQTGLSPSGLSGLYAWFLLLARAWLAPGGVAVWLVPSEFMDTRYGAALRQHLVEQVRLVSLHRADPRALAFDDALVSSAVLVLKNEAPTGAPVFSLGGAPEAPLRAAEVPLAALQAEARWTRLPAALDAPPEDAPRLGALFTVRRGLATGANRFFVLDEARAAALDLPAAALRPILPPPRLLETDRVEARPDGSPALKHRRWLLDCRWPEAELAARHAGLAAYLASGVPQISQGYLASRRRPWYAQERRAPAPLLCTYMGRGPRPFRFILNESAAVAANVYLLLYPRPALMTALQAQPGLLAQIWAQLNALPAAALTRQARVYGGGLYKLEPAELAAVPLRLAPPGRDPCSAP